MPKRKGVTNTVVRAGKRVLATDAAQGVIGAVADKMEEIAVDKADDAAEIVKEKAAKAGGRRPSSRRSAAHRKTGAREGHHSEDRCQEDRCSEGHRCSEGRCSEGHHSEDRCPEDRCSEGHHSEDRCRKAGAQEDRCRKTGARKTGARKATTRKTGARKTGARRQAPGPVPGSQEPGSVRSHDRVREVALGLCPRGSGLHAAGKRVAHDLLDRHDPDLDRNWTG